MPCAVCTLLNNDQSPKPVFWCSLCGEYICKDHESAALQRIAAATIKLTNKIIKKP